MTLLLKSSPHLRKKRTVSDMMQLVMLLALPGLAAQIYFFGWGSLIHIGIAMLVAVIAEALVLEIRKRNFEKAVKDNSALLTGFLLGISIPPFAPWWIPVIGTLFAIVIVKQLYGGLGFNLFNPAMAGYVLLLISFPVQMTSWAPSAELAMVSQSFNDAISIIFTQFSSEGYSISQMRAGVDGFTMATPLDQVKSNLLNGYTVSEALQAPTFYDSTSALSGLGNGWFWVNLLFLLGGLALLQTGVISWHLPLSMLAGLFAISSVFFLINPDQASTPLMHLFSGGCMLGAFFIITDPVTAATSNKGRIVFGFAIGVLIYVIRYWGGYPDAIAFAVLIMNMCVPVIDYYTKPRTYGHKAATSAVSGKGETE